MSREEMLARAFYAIKKAQVMVNDVSRYLPTGANENEYRYDRLNQKRRRLQTLHGGVHFLKTKGVSL